MDALRAILQKRKEGMNYVGIPSFCTANDLVIEACLKQAKRFDDYVLLEATANQVNQYGGYTGMKPADYRDFVFEIADSVGFPKDKIILGGDHLGPLTWQNEPEKDAMEKAVELVKLFVCQRRRRSAAGRHTADLCSGGQPELRKDHII